MVGPFTTNSAVIATSAPQFVERLVPGWSAAKKEGTVSIFTSTDAEQSQKLQDAFTKKYGIKIAYNDLGTNGAYNQVISETAAGQLTGDIAWNSAMDLQIRRG